MRFLKMTIAYDGTAYAGWQFQPDALTVQGAIETALTKVTGETRRVLASGRTDAGVHALAQVVSVQTNSTLSNAVLMRALNATLPHDISVLSLVPAREGFHAIRDAVNKRYRYVIDDGDTVDVFERAYCWHYYADKLDAERMHRAAQTILGTHDFASFQTSGSERTTTVRTITDIFVERRTTKMGKPVVLEIAADGFLYNMVRAIVGTLVDVGRGRAGEDHLTQVLAAKDRRAAGMNAPPQGLFMVHVDYPE
jgi:tRNA pseudouridine38-40 synthase